MKATLPRLVGALLMLAFIVVFVIATYAISQLTLLVHRVLAAAASELDILIGLGYSAVTVFSILVLGRMTYLSERQAGRVKRRIRFFE